MALLISDPFCKVGLVQLVYSKELLLSKYPRWVASPLRVEANVSSEKANCLVRTYHYMTT